MVSQMPKAEHFDNETIEKFEIAKEIITKVRSIRKEKNIPNKEKLSLLIEAKEAGFDNSFNNIITKSANLGQIQMVTDKVDNALHFLVRTINCYVPLGNMINVDEEMKRLQKELDYHKGFLDSVMKKLGNENFVKNAPEKVVETERKKKAEAEAKIASILEQLDGLK